jgi:predicted chitinase
VAGDYLRVADLAYSKRVATAYLKRHAPTAWAAGDVETLARVHNGGPRGHLKSATKGYGVRVRALTK